MRVGVVDIGTNSTRLLIADVDDGWVQERIRASIVTRLGEGVDATGELADAAVGRVFDVLAEYRKALDEHGVGTAPAVLTSAVRDASNGAQFARAVEERFNLSARTLSGDEEARLTFLGATAGRPDADGDRTLVIDIGGGSTELVARDFHVSMQCGVVRMTERHLAHDPPKTEEMQALADDVRATIDTGLPGDLAPPTRGIAVAGTPTMAAAIELELEPYDSERVEGHLLTLGVVEEQLARLATMSVEARTRVDGLHPDRAPVIVAGLVILSAVMRATGLEEVLASEHDILWGVALQA